MKKRYWSILIFLTIVSTASGSYYWYKNEKIFLQEGSMFYVTYADDSGIDIKNMKIIGEEVGTRGEKIKHGIISKKHLTNIPNVVYQTSSVLMPYDTINMYLTEKFYVRLKKAEDTVLLSNFANKYGAEIIRKGSLSYWYVLKCTSFSRYNALELANIFHESGLFGAAEPEFINSIHKTCVNDTYFNQQWNLLNSGQYDYSFVGLDINFCEAHTITSGDASIIIAVVDGGIELTHPDLNVCSISFDAHTLSSPSQIYDNHGTACAGIIGAQSNNNLGITGIAPNCPLMSISWHEWSSAENIAEGINYARRNNASVISNSWKSTPNNWISEALDSALYYGRNMKGCVVVCASGNDNMEYVRYPARYKSDIIAVGAITPSAERKDMWDLYVEPGIEAWGSNYGEQLDVVAPGIYVPTTNTNGSYRMDFRGTSAACPHVSAIAGLILSVNPELTQQEVGYIISATAQKIGNYHYTDTLNHPCGTWHKMVGYGLVDAYAAVQMALNKYIQDTIYNNGISIEQAQGIIYAGKHVTNFKTQGDVIIPSGSDVRYIASKAIRLEPGFKVYQGAHFLAKIGSVSFPNAIVERKEDITDKEETILDSYNFIERSPSVQEILPAAKKYIRNGQLLIERDHKIYNAQGMQL
ncbi:MAG: S8 family serine peptidase [Alphaproteobacteria bacterium]|nr:S8 family serine peptidase [Alphaproteobacteria bacterium]